MLYYTVDDRDGISGANGASCGTCCCQSLTMKRGETNLMQINYAPWSVPLGWLTAAPEFEITADRTACATGDVAGFAPPNLGTTTHYITPLNTVLNGDLQENGATPAGNTFTFRKIPVSGPSHGSVNVINDGTFIYTPQAGFHGYDAFWFEMEDAQGRIIRRSAVITVGTVTGILRPPEYDTIVPYVPISKVVVNQSQHTVKFPIFMPYQAADCESFRMMIKQSARDCDNSLFQHISCFDLTVKDC